MTTNLIDSSDVRIVDQPCVVGLPTSMFVEYHGRIQDGRLFVIFRPAENWEYSDFVCLIGSCDKLSRVPISETLRYRDGGTTIIKTEQGTFNFPTPFKPELKPTFNDVEITVFDRRT